MATERQQVMEEVFTRVYHVTGVPGSFMVSFCDYSQSLMDELLHALRDKDAYFQHETDLASEGDKLKNQALQLHSQAAVLYQQSRWDYFYKLIRDRGWWCYVKIFLLGLKTIWPPNLKKLIKEYERMQVEEQRLKEHLKNIRDHHDQCAQCQKLREQLSRCDGCEHLRQALEACELTKAEHVQFVEAICHKTDTLTQELQNFVITKAK